VRTLRSLAAVRVVQRLGVSSLVSVKVARTTPAIVPSDGREAADVNDGGGRTIGSG
jgi:hypothetical protein